MAKNYFNRYIWLIDLIQRSGHISFEDISRAWRRSTYNEYGEDLSERTFFNHKKAILDTFGIEIKCDRSLGYFISNDDDVQTDALKNWMLQSLSLNNIMNEGSDLRDRIICEDIPSSQRWLSDIMAAMRDGKKLELTHQGYWRDTPHTFTMAPYCLKLFKQRWYLTGLSDGYTELRTYALDRIHAVKTTNIPFKLPKGFDAREYFRKFFGIVTDNREAETVELRVDANQAKYFRSLPLHPTQEERELEDGYFMFTYRLVPTFDFTRELLSKGELIEVVSPLWLRKEIANELRNTLSMYDDVLEDVPYFSEEDEYMFFEEEEK